MKNEDNELLSIKYKIEKSGMKQQEFEDSLLSISKELKRSKRIRKLFMFLFLSVLAIVVGGVYYLKQNLFFETNNDVIIEQPVIERLQKVNDSLRNEIERLKSEIENSKKEIVVQTDSIEKIVDEEVIELSEQINIKDSNRDKSRSNQEFQKRYAIVNRVYESNGTVFISAEYVEYLRGKKALEKAKENGDVEYRIKADGDTLYYLNFEYYINKLNSRKQILELDANVELKNLNKFSIEEFQEIISYEPILILEIKNGVVYKIREKKLP